MEIAFVGLGKMGANMVRRLLQGGHTVFGYNRTYATAKAMESEGMRAFDNIETMVKALSGPRVVWLMVPDGDPVDAMIEVLRPLLKAGDVIVDGGNSRFSDTIARAEKLKPTKIHYVDAGTSGGIWGLQVGYCLMVGGEPAAFKIIEPALETLAPPNGYLHAGPHGAGHYVKMVHNGIEYGLMQAYAEGFDILEHSRYDLDLAAITKLWNQGSVVRSWLLELTENIFTEDPKLEKLEAFVKDSGEGRWTVQESIDLAVPAPVITLALQARFRSRRESNYSDRYLAALRNQFGGHAVKKKGE